MSMDFWGWLPPDVSQRKALSVFKVDHFHKV